MHTERQMLQKLKNHNIVGMKCAWKDRNHYYLLFDYAMNGDLSKFLKSNGK